ncbi:MAG: DNA repair protein RadA [Alphaproteobacteria bacterium]|nr:DNA repair protein RadA [Alphaproteobacteria bacterium]
MARPASQFVCQQCGASHRKWAGKCDDCGAWNSITEEAAREAAPKGVTGAGGRPVAFVPLEGTEEQAPRITTGISEFDRVCGGGLVAGSALLVGGDPGIGKSTLLLQAMAGLANASTQVAYISGEEAVDQIRSRATRLGMSAAPVGLATATSVRDILATLDMPDAPRVVVIDSIQTMYVDTLDSAPGTVAQVRSAAQELIRLAKRRNLTLVLVGHVTKEGAIAGPRVLEHMVDTVLYFEGERGHQFRLLRAVKNRYGPTDEIGVFEMTGTGLAEVANPSELFLAGHSDNVNGTVVFAGIEGTRPVLVEIQALVSPTALGTARRAVVGWDSARLAMILAVLQSRCGLNLGAADVYLNVAGGLRISEPAADLAVAAALISAHLGQLLPERTVVFGEIGLGGEVRAVGQSDARLKEAEKLGFTSAIVPQASPRRRGDRAPDSAIATRNMASLHDLFAIFEGALAAGKTAAL